MYSKLDLHYCSDFRQNSHHAYSIAQYSKNKEAYGRLQYTGNRKHHEDICSGNYYFIRRYITEFCRSGEDCNVINAASVGISRILLWQTEERSLICSLTDNVSGKWITRTRSVISRNITHTHATRSWILFSQQ